MKKLLALTLCTLMILTVFAGCSSSAPATPAPSEPTDAAPANPSQSAEAPAEPSAKPFEGVTLNILDVSYAATNGLIEYIDEFEEMTGMEVNVEINAYADVNTKKEVELSAGSDAYDVMHICSATVSRLGNAGWVEDLTPYIASAADYDIDDFIQFSRDTLTVNGTPYGIPVTCETHMLYYRKDIVEELGIAIPTTLEELVEACKAVKAARDDIYAISLRGRQGQGANMFVVPTFFYATGGAYWTPDRSQLLLNSPETVAGIKVYADLIQNYAPPGAADFDYTASYTAFTQGEAVFYLDNSGLPGTLDDPEVSAIVGKWDCVPVFPAQNVQCIPSFAHGLCINSNSKEKEAAWAYIEWYTGKVMQERLGAEVGFIGTARSSARENDTYLSKFGGTNWITAFAESIPSARPDHRLLELMEWPYIGDTLGKGVQNIALGEDAQAVMDKLQEDMTVFFEQQGYLQ